MLGPTPRGFNLIGLVCSVVSEMFKSSSEEARNVNHWPVTCQGLPLCPCWGEYGDPERNGTGHLLLGAPRSLVLVCGPARLVPVCVCVCVRAGLKGLWVSVCTNTTSV